MADDGAREFPAEQILTQSSAYPPMANHECQMSTLILSAAYPELRYVKGTRRRVVAAPSTEPVATEVLHWWNELPDGTVIDSAFQHGPNTARQQPYVTLRYIEEKLPGTERQGADAEVRMLRQGIKRRMKTCAGNTEERRREVVEALRDDLPRLRREFEPGVVIQPRTLRGDKAVGATSPSDADGDAEIPPAFRRRP